MKGQGHMVVEREGFTFEEIDSEADYILFSREEGVLSEHFTPSEAAMAYYQIASEIPAGHRLPVIFKRGDDRWLPAN